MTAVCGRNPFLTAVCGRDPFLETLDVGIICDCKQEHMTGQEGKDQYCNLSEHCPTQSVQTPAFSSSWQSWKADWDDSPKHAFTKKLAESALLLAMWLLSANVWQSHLLLLPTTYCSQRPWQPNTFSAEVRFTYTSRMRQQMTAKDA